jgi:hypothetical protein
VLRYDLDRVYRSGEYTAHMEQSPVGEWVAYVDVAILNAAKDVLALEVVETRVQRDGLGDAVKMLRHELDEVRAFLEREGYRRCDILACNCGSWHQQDRGWRHRWHDKLGRRENEPEGAFYERVAMRLEPVTMTHQPDCGLTKNHWGRCASRPDERCSEHPAGDHEWVCVQCVQGSHDADRHDESCGHG